MRSLTNNTGKGVFPFDFFALDLRVWLDPFVFYYHLLVETPDDVFQGPNKAILVQKDAYLLELARYASD
jgi:hypothetical protein